jgi:hypothetical protein
MWNARFSGHGTSLILQRQPNQPKKDALARIGRILILLPGLGAAGSDAGLGGPSNPQPGRLALGSVGVPPASSGSVPLPILAAASRCARLHIHDTLRTKTLAQRPPGAQTARKGPAVGQPVDNGVLSLFPLFPVQILWLRLAAQGLWAKVPFYPWNPRNPWLNSLVAPGGVAPFCGNSTQVPFQ